MRKGQSNRKEELIQTHLIITKTEKGNTLVILYRDYYNKKSKTLFHKLL